jgi:DNA-binding NarL/FixJ family response regulator
MTALRVLIVDNQRSIRRSLRSSLGTFEQDVDILEATSGEEALLVFARQPLDLLITDARLAGISGIELFDRLRQVSPNLKAILISNGLDEKTRQQALEARVDGLLLKPVAPAEFMAAVRRCLGEEGEAFQEIVSPETDAGDLTQHLEARRQELGALAALLLDGSGEILSRTGEMLAIDSVKPLIPALLEALNASARLSRALGGQIPDDLLCLAGTKLDLYAAHMGVDSALLVVFDNNAVGNTRARAARLVSEAVQELVSMLPRREAPMQPVQEKTEMVPDADVSAEGEGIADLETIFHQASLLRFNREDIDQFWETAVEQQANSPADDPGSPALDETDDSRPTSAE